MEMISSTGNRDKSINTNHENLYNIYSYSKLTNDEENDLKVLYRLLAKDSLIVFRGDCYADIENLYNNSKETLDLESLIQKIFFYGQKSDFFKKIFLNKITDSENLDENIFSNIFKEINGLVSNSDSSLKYFIQDNKMFSDFFESNSNLTKFLSTVSEQDEIEKTLIRDYYWFLLHTHESNHFKECSTLISCSSNIDIAKKYSDGIIFEYFIPKPFSRYAITSMFTMETSSFISSLGLPSYNIKKGIYDEEEEEISVRRCLFPHFILKVYIESEDKWFLNPHFFNKVTNNNLKEISKDGFSINQKNFKQLLKSDTKFKSGIHLAEDRFFNIK